TISARYTDIVAGSHPYHWFQDHRNKSDGRPKARRTYRSLSHSDAGKVWIPNAIFRCSPYDSHTVSTKPEAILHRQECRLPAYPGYIHIHNVVRSGPSASWSVKDCSLS